MQNRNLWVVAIDALNSGLPIDGVVRGMMLDEVPDAMTLVEVMATFD